MSKGKQKRHTTLHTVLTVLLLTYFPILLNLVEKSEQLVLISVLLEQVKHATILIASPVWPKLFKEHVDFRRNMVSIIKFYIKNQSLNI